MDKDNRFLCPLLWRQLSFHPDGCLRPCCHANIRLENASLQSWGKRQTLANEGQLQKIRTKMLNGERPSECQTCIKDEAISGQSHRLQYLEKFDLNIFNEEPRVEIIDLTLGNRCNLTCRMCTPMFSDRIGDDWRELGLPFDQELKKKADNFEHDFPWQIFDSWSLKEIYFQGGEPFITPLHQQILLRLIEQKKSANINLTYNTNLTALPQKTLDLLSQFKSINFGLSIDGIGEVAEYIRYPLSWSIWEKNLDLLFNFMRPQDQIHVLTTIQAYNFLHLPKILTYITSTFGNIEWVWKSIRSPSFLSIQALTPSQIEQGIATVKSWKKDHPKESKNLQIDALLRELSSTKTDPQKRYQWTYFTKRLDAKRRQHFFNLDP